MLTGGLSYCVINEQLSDKAVEGLAQLKSLREVMLFRTQTPDDSLEKLKKARPGLQITEL